MASVSVVLRTDKKPKSDGTYAVAIRISKNRKTRYIFTGKYILEKEWDKKKRLVKRSHPNSKKLNNLLLKKVSEINDQLITAETNEESLSLLQIKQRIKKEGCNSCFFPLADERILSYERKGTFSVANAEKSILNNIEKYHGSRDLSFKEITVDFLERYRTAFQN